MLENETGENQTTPPVAEETITKIVSKRINEIRDKDRAELAKAMGYESWEDAMDSGLDKQLLDAGIDPVVGKPIIDKAIDTHPEVLRARAMIAEAEKAKTEAELQKLNAKYKLTITSIDELDPDTRSLIDKGIPIDRAYAVVHYDALAEARYDTFADAQKNTQIGTAKIINSQSLSHMSTIPGAGATNVSAIAISKADIDNVRRYMPNATEAQIKKFLTDHPETKF